VTIYLISGLGADKRMFQRLRFSAACSIVHIDWVEPLAKEALADYCKRLSKNIDSSQAFSLVGLSFGGIVAIEIAKFLAPQKVIIISSMATSKEMPWTFTAAKFLRLYKLVPLAFLKTPSLFLNWLFGAKTGEEKALLKQVISNTSPVFLAWSIDRILNWQNTDRPQNLFHIHGTADKLLLCRNTKADYKIKGGEHLMVFSQAEEVSAVIAKVLAC
jgi:pimeloyl-ACP methyl ester carboxylesterase